MSRPRSPQTRPPDANFPWKGRIVAERYQVFEGLGAGGMGEVYLARHIRTDALVVLKVPKMEFIGNKGFADRFHREIKSLARLAHRHIVAINDADEHEGLPFAVMRYLTGGTLNDDRHRPIWPDTGMFAPMGVLQAVGPWLSQVAEAIDFVHENNFIHRDIKPSNILFDDQGVAYLGDFGVAKVIGDINESARSILGAGGDSTIASGRLVGTPQYIAPERFLGQESRFSDQYALAVTVFELIAGRNPFCRQLEAMMRQILVGAGDIRTVLRVVPSAAADVLARGMASRPEERFASCSEFAAAMSAAIPGGEMAIEPVAEAQLACPECNVVLAVEAAYGGDVLECEQCGSRFVPQRHLAWLEPAAVQPEILARQTQRLGEDLQLLQDATYQKCANCGGAILVHSGEGSIGRPCPHCGGPLDGAGRDQGFEASPVVPTLALPPVSAALSPPPHRADPQSMVVVVNPRRQRPLDYRRERKHREQRQDLFAVVAGVVIAIVLIVILFSL